MALRNKKIIIFSLFTILSMQIFQNLPFFLGCIFFSGESFREVSSNIYKANIINPNYEKYFVTLGRPRAHCDIYADDRLVFKGISENNDVRQSLLVGAAIDSRITKLVTINCNGLQSGFKARTSHRPYLLPYFPGMLTHLISGFTEIVIGPVLSLFVFIAGLFGLRYLKNKFSNFISSLAVLMYFFSISYIARLFLQGDVASIIHPILRTILSVALYVFLTVNSVRRISVYLVNALGAVFLIYFGIYKIEKLFDVYNVVFLIFPISTAIALFDSWESLKYENSFVKSTYITLLLSQIIDVLFFFFGWGNYSTSYVLAIIHVPIIYKILANIKVQHLLQEIRLEVQSLFSKDENPITTFEKIAYVLHRHTKFQRISCYVDSFYLSKSSHIGNSLVRTCEHGYEKDTLKDSEILFSDERGEKMKMVMAIQSPQIYQSEVDNAYFVIVPISKKACINLSNKIQSDPSLAQHDFLIIKNVYDVLSLLNERLDRYLAPRLGTMDKLRNQMREGKYQRIISAMFVDIDDSSKMLESYGQNFSKFIHEVYWPALARCLSSICLPETICADGMALFSFDETREDEICSSIDSLPFMLNKTKSFQENEGNILCAEAGYTKITLHVGGSVGTAEVIVDQYSVRIASEIPTIAYRLMSAAPRDGIYVSNVLKENLVKFDLMIFKEGELIEKKNKINYIELKIHNTKINILKFVS